MNDEIWKDIPNYEGLYQVSNLGRVRALKRKIKYKNGNCHTYPEKIKNQVNSCGYLAVTLSKKGQRRQIKVHRLVALAFIPNPHHYQQINHKDENKHNNQVDNLEWCNAKYNNNYGTKIKRTVAHTDYHLMAMHQDHKRTGYLSSLKLSYPVGQYDKNNKLIKTWKSAREVQKIFGWDRSYIEKCCRGVGKTSHGYVWKYI